ncbi:MAG: hypothetical protein ACHREM_15985, partial [Polyangiales bacterium]
MNRAPLDDMANEEPDAPSAVRSDAAATYASLVSALTFCARGSDRSNQQLFAIAALLLVWLPTAPSWPTT